MHEHKETPALIRVREAAALLSLPVSLAYALVYARRLPVVRLGRRSLRVPRSAIERFVEEALTVSD